MVLRSTLPARTATSPNASGKPPGLRERKRARTRAALRSAALELFDRKGYDATSADEIAEQAAVGRSTFFRYFGTKEAVLFAWREELGRSLAELFAEGDEADDAYARTQRVALTVAARYQEGRDDVLRVHRIVHSSPQLIARELEVDRLWETVLVEGLDSFYLARHRKRRVPAAVHEAHALYAGAVMGVVRVIFRAWAAEEGKRDLPKLVGEGLDRLAAGTLIARDGD